MESQTLTKAQLSGLEIICMVLLVFLLIPVTQAQSSVSYQVGAYADSMSSGNLGVNVSILTHAYNIDLPNLPTRADAFYVGSGLAGNGFIQFGYELQQGGVCLKGFFAFNGTGTCMGDQEEIPNGDARWFWEYWPDALGRLGFYFEIGTSNSAGRNGTWHSYTIVDSSDKSWSFILDGVQVASLNVKPLISRDPPFEAAEQVTVPTQPLGRLGPVEFQNLSYFRSAVWRPVEFLKPFKSCGIIGRCSLPNPYNVTLLGENDLIAGSLTPFVLHPVASSPTSNIYSVYIDASVIVGIISVTTYYVVKKRHFSMP